MPMLQVIVQLPASAPPPAATCSTAVGNTQHTTHCSPSLQNSSTHTAAPACSIYLHTAVPVCRIHTHTQFHSSFQYLHTLQCQPVSANLPCLSNQCVFLTVHCCRPNLLHCVENPISTHPIRQETRHIKIYEPEMFVGLVGHEFLVLFPASHFPL